MTVQLGTSPNDYLAPDMTFANNLNGAQTVLAAGTINLLPIVNPTLPNDYFVVIPVSPPFTYDSTAGDLVVDVELPASAYSGTGAATTDYVFGSGVPATRIFNFDASGVATSTNLEAGVVIGLDIVGGASVNTYGEGCVERFSASFYETFAGPTVPDLAGVTGSSTNSALLTLNGSGDGYNVTSGSNNWFVPTSTDLGLGDDTVSPPYTMPWTFTHPGGSTGQITVSSNGYVWLDGTSTGSDFSPTSAEFVGQAARIAGAWQDLSPQVAGSVHIDVDPTGDPVYVTFLGVPEFNQAAALNDFQMVMFQNGDIELRWQGLDIVTGSMLIGYTPGNTANPGPTDISASYPFSTQPDLLPLQLSGDNRPILGTTHTGVISGVPPGSTLTALVLGFADIVPGMDLSGMGAPGCLQHLVPSDTLAFPAAAGGQATYSIAIPNDPALVGLDAYLQAAAFAPGVNALGVTFSNGLALVLGSL